MNLMSLYKSEKVEARAPAKLNLYLHITDRNARGYHILDSLVYKLPLETLSDIITIQPNSEGRITCQTQYDHDLNIGSAASCYHDFIKDEDNLILKAAFKLREHYGQPNMGADIRLEKKIPLAAGLGGGSSDAAITLLNLSTLWNLTTSEKELKALGFSLGADIPVFLQSSSLVHIQGMGEIIKPLDDKILREIDKYFLLINPKVIINTGQCFQHYSKYYFTGSKVTNSFLKNEEFNREDIKDINFSKNDLFESACALAPIVRDVISLLQEQKGCNLARLTGSGPTCFGLFKQEQDLLAAYYTLKNQKPAWWLLKGQLFL